MRARLLLPALLLPGHLCAQEPGALVGAGPGDRVRVRGPGAAPYREGMLRGERGDTLLLDLGTGRERVLLSGVERVEVLREPDRERWAWGGGFAGALAMALILLGGADDPSSPSAGEALTLAAGGGAVGALAGTALAPRRWETAYLRRVPAPQGAGGAGTGARRSKSMRKRRSVPSRRSA